MSCSIKVKLCYLTVHTQWYMSRTQHYNNCQLIVHILTAPPLHVKARRLLDVHPQCTYTTPYNIK